MNDKPRSHAIEKAIVTAAVTSVTLAATMQGTQWGKQLANKALELTEDPDKMKNVADFVGTVVGGAVAFGASNIAVNSVSFSDKISQERDTTEDKTISR